MSVASHDLLITALETNSHHGVGILLQRFFPDSSSFVCLRTTSQHGGEEPFGSAHHELCSRYLSLEETEAHLRRILSLYPVRRILCVPYYREEFIHALIAQRITGAPLCTYLMDDQNIFAPHVPDHWVADLLAASQLRLGISPEMCAAYHRKFRREIHLLPPVLAHTPPLVPCYWHPEPDEPPRAAMIGNVWTARRFTQLRELLRASGLRVDWYGKGPQAAWLPGAPEEWEADHLHCMGFYPEEDLVAALASYPFIVLPSGSLDAEDDNPAFSRLSLPSRLLFLHATTDTPVLVLGSEQTAAGRFVTRLGTGLCARYDPADLQARIGQLLEPGTRAKLQAGIRHWSGFFVQENAGQWIWDSLEAGRPQPAAFHAAFPADAAGPRPWIEAIKPARPRLDRPLPPAGAAFRDAHAAAFGYLRTSHLPLLAAGGLPLPPAEEIELSLFQAAAASYIVQGALPAGGQVLFLGPALPASLQNLPAPFKVWRVADLPEWQQSGYAGDPRHVVEAATGRAHPAVFPQFDAIVSTSWCGELGPDPHPLEGLSLYLAGCTRPGGINLHFFSAVLHPAFFWAGPAHPYLQRRFLGDADWPGLDELLLAPDLFTMSQAAYDRDWKPATGKSYAESGRPLSLGLFWRKP
jgi:hypothetical protein